MTTSKAAERERRYGGGGAADVFTIRGALASACLVRARELGVDNAPKWPMVRYQKDPLGFFRDVLGVELMVEQEEIADGVLHNVLVAISGGRKVGKDFIVACIALWYFSCCPKARVMFTAVTEEQVARIFWYQLVELVNGSGRCLACKRVDPAGPRPCPHSQLIIEGDPPLGCRIGLKRDGSEAFGFTVAEAAAIRGISGTNQLSIVDEMSDVDDRQIATLISNAMGSEFGRFVGLSNPACSEGQFFRAFHQEQHLWRTFSRSSLEIATKYGGKIPGIARLDNIAREIEMHGADSDYIAWNVHGRFVHREPGQIFTVAILEASVARWASAPAEGPLVVGVDVAGETGTGDESAFSAVRGLRQLSLHGKRGLTPEAHLVEVLGLLAANPRQDPNELPTVVIDRGGEAGSKVWGVFVAYRQIHWKDPPFRLVGVDSSRKAERDPKAYERVRDELAATLADWVRAGGAILNDRMLCAELNEFRWIEQTIKNVNHLIDKKKIRARLNRSPDRADATALSTWYRPRPTPATGDAAAAPPATDVQGANEVWFPEGGGAPAPEAGDDPWWPKG